MAPQGGAAPSPKAQGTAAAAIALLAHKGAAGSAAGKTPGKAGLSPALEPGASKAGTRFLELVKAKTAGTGTATAAGDLAAALKNAARTAAAGAAQGLPAELAQAAAQGAQNAHAGKASAHEDKDTAKKKAAALIAGTADAAVLAMATFDLAKLPKQAAAEPADLRPAVAATHAGAAKAAEPLVKVVDLRTRARSAAADDAASVKTVSLPGAADKDAAQGGFVQKLASTAGATAADKAAAPAAPAPLPGDTALDRLRDAAGAELIRASNLVLRDGGGEIRLVLKPESLGSVRIRMNVIDNAIEGKIVVDSSSVKQVMDANLDALRRALTAEGFQMGSLQVSVGGQDTNPRQQQQDPQQPAEAVRRVAAAGFDQAVPGAESMSLGDLFVNLFV